MNLVEHFKDKSTKPKEKNERLCKALSAQIISVDALLDFAETAKDPIKASCIEALEFLSREHPSMIPKRVISFVASSLSAKAPRVKWESAKVLGNMAATYVNEYAAAIPALLDNTEFDGTVVRWSAAYAIGEIIQHKSKWQKELIVVAQKLSESEEKDSIKKIYKQSLKRLQAATK